MKDRIFNKLHSGADFQAAHQGSLMKFDRTDRDPKVARNLLCRIAFDQKLQDLSLPRCEGKSWLRIRTEVFVRPQPLIAVTNVEASSRWYQHLLGCESAHGGPEYERLVANGTLILQLHSFEIDHHHGPIGDPGSKPYGNGVLLWFEVDDIDAAIARAVRMKAEVVMPRHRNPPSGDGGPNHWELWLRDPDGYTVVLASPDGSAG